MHDRIAAFLKNEDRHTGRTERAGQAGELLDVVVVQSAVCIVFNTVLAGVADERQRLHRSVRILISGVLQDFRCRQGPTNMTDIAIINDVIPAGTLLEIASQWPDRRLVMGRSLEIFCWIVDGPFKSMGAGVPS